MGLYLMGLFFALSLRVTTAPIFFFGEAFGDTAFFGEAFGDPGLFGLLDDMITQL